MNWRRLFSWPEYQPAKDYRSDPYAWGRWAILLGVVVFLVAGIALIGRLVGT